MLKNNLLGPRENKWFHVTEGNILSDIEKANIIQQWMNKYVPGVKKNQLDHDLDLNEIQLMDSLTFVDFLFFCEAEFSLTFPDDEIRQENFRTINTIVSLLEKI